MSKKFAGFMAATEVADVIQLKPGIPASGDIILKGGGLNQDLVYGNGITTPQIVVNLSFENEVTIDTTGRILTATFTGIVSDQRTGFSLINLNTSEVIPITPLSNLGVVDSFRWQTSRVILSGENLTLTYDDTVGTCHDSYNNFLSEMSINGGTDATIVNNSTQL